MEKLAVCRICLDENVHVHVIENTQLQEIYERLTTIPFQTSDMRPLALCYICHGQLKSSRRLMLKCLKAEEILTEMLNQLRTKVHEVPKPVVIGRSALTQLTMTKTHHLNIESVDQHVDVRVRKQMPIIYEEEIGVKLEPKSVQEIPEVVEISDSEPYDEHSFLVPMFEKPFAPETDIEIVIEQPITHHTTMKAGDGLMKEAPMQWERSRKKERSKKAKIENVVTKAQTNDMNNLNKDTGKAKKLNDCVPTDNKFTCTVCNKVFEDKRRLRRHMNQHVTARPYICRNCRKGYIITSYLEAHSRAPAYRRKYSNVSRFFCDFCKKGFSVKGSLASHLRTHTGDKPFVCNICNRRFKQRGHLKNHLALHAEKKPYTCNICNKGFNLKSYLIVHARRHTGEKPYVCEVCQRKYHSRAILRAHLRKVHMRKQNDVI